MATIYLIVGGWVPLGAMGLFDFDLFVLEDGAGMGASRWSFLPEAARH